MNLRRSRLWCLLWLAWLVSLVFLPACSAAKQNQTREPQALTVGLDNSAISTLIHIAASQGFFAVNGLNVTIQPYPSGLASLDAAIDGEVDVAVASEFVLVGKIFDDQPIQSWGSIDRFLHIYLIGRSGQGIQNVDDLRGKKIGLPFQTAAEFYLGRYLDLKGLRKEEVTLVNIAPTDLTRALLNGEVDAVILWQPYIRVVEDQLGSEPIFRWPVQSDQVGYGNLVSRADWIQAHPEQVKNFLQALVQAEGYFASNPQGVRAILKKNLSFDDDLIDATLTEHQFQVSLDQSMILAMEDEARWMITKQVVTNQKTPNFLNNLYLDGLQAVRPDSVQIIR